MKCVSAPDEAELKTLECAHENHPVARVRNRAHVTILSGRGCQLGQIADICGMSRQAVSRVMEKWEKIGVRGLPRLRNGADGVDREIFEYEMTRQRSELP